MVILEHIRGILFQKLFLLRGNQICVVTDSPYQKPRSAWAPWPPLPHHHQLEENEKTWGIRINAEILTSNLSNKKKKPFSSLSLTSGCWLRVAAAPWWPAEWWRRADARRHRPPTGPSSPAEGNQICSIKQPSQNNSHRKSVNTLTVWQSTSLKTLVVQMMKMMEAVDNNKR